jgi:adenylate cyclase
VASVEFQLANRTHNEELSDEVRPALRVGIAMGEVVIADSTVTGEGVVLAQRLEQLAHAGGVYIHDAVYQIVPKRLPFEYENLGEHEIKGFDDLLRVYSVRERGGPIASATEKAPRPKPPLDLPEKRSIAVLPFENMSPDPDQEFFGDGISEDIITELSKFRSLFVIARNSSFIFKGHAVDVKEVSEKLGVRYVVEGSVRRAGRRVRITAQLIDAIENRHLWADRFDREIEDIFAVQDEVTHAIVLAIEPTLASSERQRAARKPPDSLDAWECYQRGLWQLFHYTYEGCLGALELMQRAVELDPTFSSAQAGLAFTLYYTVLMEFSENRGRDLERAMNAAKEAVMLDENDAFSHVALGRLYTITARHDAAIAACDTAIAINPSFANAHFGRAHSLWHAGRAAEAIESHDEAICLSPRDPMTWAFLASKAIALLMLGRHEEAIECSRRAQQQPNAGTFAYAAEVSALGRLGLERDAGDAVARLRRHKADVSVGFFRRALPVTHEPSRERFFSGLLRAGLPE